MNNFAEQSSQSNLVQDNNSLIAPLSMEIPSTHEMDNLGQEIDAISQDIEPMQHQHEISNFASNSDYNNWSMSANSVVDDPGYSGNDRAQMWHQNNYMTSATESGFQSSYTTPGTSVSGRDTEDNEGNFIRSGTESMTGSVYHLDSIPHSETSSVHSSASGIADPKVFIPEFIRTMQDKIIGQDIKDEYLEKISKFCSSFLVLNAVIHSKELVEILVGIMNKASESIITINPESNEFKKAYARAKSTSDVMKSMSVHLDGRKAIILCDGIKGLMNFLHCPIDSMMHVAITTLHNIILTQNEKDFEEKRVVHEAMKTIKATGQGVAAFTSLLNRPGNNASSSSRSQTSDQVDKLRAIVIDCLRMLSTGDSETKQFILKNNIPQKLVEILRTKQGYVNLILVTSKFLKVLTVCPKNKEVIIQIGGLDALASCLTHENDKVKRQCILAIRNLSDKASSENISNINHLISTLVDMLAYNPEDKLHLVTVCSASILHNLACNNPINKMAICKANGLVNLVNAIKSHGKNSKLLSDAVDALRSIIGGHDKSDEAHEFLLNRTDCAFVLLHQLKNHMDSEAPGQRSSTNKQMPRGPHWPSVKSILELINNLAQKPQNQKTLRESLLVEEVKHLLCFVVRTFLLPSPPVDEIRQIVQVIISCILAMSKDQKNREIYRDERFIQVLVDLLGWIWNHQIESYKTILVLTLRTLYELSFDQICGYIIMKTNRLENLIVMMANSSNTEIAKVAVGIKQNISSIPDDVSRHMQNMGPPQQQPHMISNQQCPPEMYGPNQSHINTNQPPMNYPNRFSGGPPTMPPQGIQQKPYNPNAIGAQTSSHPGGTNTNQPMPPSYGPSMSNQPPDYFHNQQISSEFVSPNFPEGEMPGGQAYPSGDFPPPVQGGMSNIPEGQFYNDNAMT